MNTLKPVGPEERRYGFFDNFSIWFGAGISIAEFWAGAILTAPPLSLSLLEAFVAILLGHVVGTLLLSLVGVVGFDTGLPTMFSSRMAFGVKGSYIVSILNYLQLIGWTAVMLIVGARAMDEVVKTVLGFEAYYAWILLLGVAVTLWSVIGPEKWRPLEKASATLLLILSAWLTYVVSNKTELWRLPNVGFILRPEFWVGVDLVVAMPISWAPLIADYSRFSRNVRSAFWGSYVGYFISSSLFYILGAVSNALLGSKDPIWVIASYGLGIPAMLIIIFSTTTTTFLDVYSAAITYKNIRPTARMNLHIVIAGVLGTFTALLLPMEEYEWFLILIGGAFTSFTAILIIDWILSRHKYTPDSILTEVRNYKWSAITSWIVGFTLFILLAAPSLIPELYIPFFTEAGSVAGSTILTLVITSLLYYFLRKSSRNP